MQGQKQDMISSALGVCSTALGFLFGWIDFTGLGNTILFAFVGAVVAFFTNRALRKKTEK